jgi:DNA-binding response OmpR family regulator
MGQVRRERKICRECGRDYDLPFGSCEWMGLIVNLDKIAVEWMNQPIKVSMMRTKFLFLMVEARGEQVSMWRFTQLVAGEDPEKTVQVHMSYMRRCFEAHMLPFDVRHAGKGKGYKLVYIGFVAQAPKKRKR